MPPHRAQTHLALAERVLTLAKPCTCRNDPGWGVMEGMTLWSRSCLSLPKRCLRGEHKRWKRRKTFKPRSSADDKREGSGQAVSGGARWSPRRAGGAPREGRGPGSAPRQKRSRGWALLPPLPPPGSGRSHQPLLLGGAALLGRLPGATAAPVALDVQVVGVVLGLQLPRAGVGQDERPGQAAVEDHNEQDVQRGISPRPLAGHRAPVGAAAQLPQQWPQQRLQPPRLAAVHGRVRNGGAPRLSPSARQLLGAAFVPGGSGPCQPFGIAPVFAPIGSGEPLGLLPYGA